jgi:purine-binding chemotaxis protein CheW
MMSLWAGHATNPAALSCATSVPPIEERRMSAFEQTAPNHIVLFTLDEPRYALPLSAVERVVRAVEITPLPKAPEIVLGAIDAQGRVIPVVDVRKRFRLPTREMDMDDRFIIARTSLAVDSVIGIRTLADGEVVSAEQALPFAEYLRGVAKMEDGIVLIYDLDQFLSLDEEHMLDAALSGGSE